ncbi:DUF7305 domain-containing protein [Tissierella creatinophila]|uniref:DUF7305 domain-containing protein n=1 Tax=Tissierella creatinophila DSM 6911 TaxID=1123403 RepID=A0A1U7M630_TISCR|nr:polymer-forming cytoskeletal protein [Tissierella creatinophila]OLS02741.1 hypothetical protein TICRE_12810 [Tissierella creatinophila DSM 6911]
MKNRKGSTLILTLMVFVFLSILATATVSFMVSENNQSIAHKDKIEAYYIARSGAEAVEAAILSITDEKEKENLLKNLPKNVDISGMDLKSNELLEVKVKQEDNIIVIESKGIVGKGSEIVEKVMESTTESEGDVISNIDSVIFSNTNMVFESNTQNNITGNIGTNSLKNDTIKFTSGFNKNITIKIPFGADSSKIINKPSTNKDIPNIEYIEKRNYPLYNFPQYPIDLLNKGIIKTNWDNSNPIINSSSYYDSIIVDQDYSLTIDANKSDVILRVKDFNVSQGHLKILGHKDVKIFIENFISLKGSFNNENNNKNVEIYYNGDKEMNIMNETKINGSIYLKSADFNLGNGGSINGNIISGGKKISISGGTYIQDGLIYAPNAKLTLTAGGKINGAIICNDFNMSGGGSITYSPQYIDSVSVKFPSTNKKTVFKNSYYK